MKRARHTDLLHVDLSRAPVKSGYPLLALSLYLLIGQPVEREPVSVETIYGTKASGVEYQCDYIKGKPVQRHCIWVSGE